MPTPPKPAVLAIKQSQLNQLTAIWRPFKDLANDKSSPGAFFKLQEGLKGLFGTLLEPFEYSPPKIPVRIGVIFDTDEAGWAVMLRSDEEDHYLGTPQYDLINAKSIVAEVFGDDVADALISIEEDVPAA